MYPACGDEVPLQKRRSTSLLQNVVDWLAMFSFCWAKGSGVWRCAALGTRNLEFGTWTLESGVLKLTSTFSFLAKTGSGRTNITRNKRMGLRGGGRVPIYQGIIMSHPLHRVTSRHVTSRQGDDYYCRERGFLQVLYMYLSYPLHFPLQDIGRFSRKRVDFIYHDLI